MDLKIEKHVTLEIGPPTAAYMPGIKKIVRRTQTALIKHHDRVIDIFTRYGLATDGSLAMLKPGTREPFEMDDSPYGAFESKMTVLVVPNFPAVVDPNYPGHESDPNNPHYKGNPNPSYPGYPVPVPAGPDHPAAFVGGYEGGFPIAPDVPSVADAKLSALRKQGEKRDYPIWLRDPDATANKPDIEVHSYEEEGEARANGYTEVVTGAGVQSGYPKLLRYPNQGTDGKPDLLVHSADEEKTAQADGYTVEIPAPADYPVTVAEPNQPFSPTGIR
jgi:hypothetical protein